MKLANQSANSRPTYCCTGAPPGTMDLSSTATASFLLALPEVGVFFLALPGTGMEGSEQGVLGLSGWGVFFLEGAWTEDESASQLIIDA